MPNKNNKSVPMPTFNEVGDARLRTWNRCSTFFNIKSNFGEEKAREYAELFSDAIKAQMLAMFTYVTAKGYEEVKREINREATLGSVH